MSDFKETNYIKELEALTHRISRGESPSCSPEMKALAEKALGGQEEVEKMSVKEWAHQLTESVFGKQK